MARDRRHDLDALQRQWRLAEIRENQALTAKIHARIFTPRKNPAAPLSLLLKGTNFQIQVWQALLRIPFGSVVAYEGIASRIGRPTACRAAATAIARNTIAYLVPCHRVIRKIGTSGEYRWGRERKRIMLACEGAALAHGPRPGDH